MRASEAVLEKCCWPKNYSRLFAGGKSIALYLSQADDSKARGARLYFCTAGQLRARQLSARSELCGGRLGWREALGCEGCLYPHHREPTSPPIPRLHLSN